MGGGGRKQGKEKKCSCFFFFNIFRGCWSWRSSYNDCSEDKDDGVGNLRRARLVGEDEFQWVVAEQGIDRKASDFIKKFHDIHEP